MSKPQRRWPYAVAISLCNVMTAPEATAQSAPSVAPACACGPSALPAYRVPYPQPAYRPLNGMHRSGVTYKQGATFASPRTNLGSSSYAPTSAPAVWDGLYVGLNGGYGHGRIAVRDALVGHTSSHGAFGGVHLGRNWQWGQFVLGIEADLAKSWAAGNTAALTSGQNLTSGHYLHSTRDWTASIRGRVGYAVGPVLAYVTAGAAIAEHTVTVTNGPISWRDAETLGGYVYGGGLEWQIVPQISVRGEVLRYEFNDRTLVSGGTQARLKLDETVVRAGLSYRFN
jgi:outer membrane immunogenic protein